MRLGDVEGLGTVYRSDGSAILRSNEKIKKEMHTKFGGVRFKKEGLRFLPGDGKYIFTNKRLILVRRPRTAKEIRRQLAGGGGPDSPATHYSYFYFIKREKTVRNKEDIKEFVELPYTEITALKIGLLGTLIEVQDIKREYQVFVSRKIGKMFKELLKECGIYV